MTVFYIINHDNNISEILSAWHEKNIKKKQTPLYYINR